MVADEDDMGFEMQRILAAVGQAPTKNKTHPGKLTREHRLIKRLHDIKMMPCLHNG